MAHEISAIVGSREILAELSRALGVSGIIGLPQGLALIPLAQRAREHSGGSPENVEVLAGFRNLSVTLAEVLRAASSKGAVAYLETEYHGGDGTQGATAWKDGNVVTRHPNRDESERLSSERSPINLCLREIGVVKTSGSIDEFDSIGLGAFRSTEDWVKKIGSEVSAVITVEMNLEARRLRILHISTRLILGGSQENTVLSCEEQTRRGHEVHLAFGPIYGPEGSLLERVEKFVAVDGRRITTHVVPNLVREVSPSQDARARRELRELIERLRPDVVHTHSSKAGILGRFAAWESKLRPTIVHTIHGPPFMPIEGNAFKRLKTRVVNHVYTIAERKAAMCCHGIISVADAMTREFLRRKIGKPEQYTTVRSGIEQEAYLSPPPGESRDDVRSAIGLGANDFVVGTVARLAEHKGHDDLLDALGARLKADARWKLLWVGDGWWRERLVARAKSMGLGVRELDREPPTGGERSRQEEGIEGRGIEARGEEGKDKEHAAQVICTGLVPPMRVPGLIRAMDVLAHPSSREGLPRTVPQALLCGVCPVAYDVDGTGEACVEMVTGRLVPAGNAAKLREAIEWCESRPSERQGLASAGRERCTREFSVAAMVDGLERAYDKARAIAAKGTR